MAVNSTNYASGTPITTTTTIPAFSPIGLLLALTYSAAVKVNIYSEPTTNYTKQSVNSTNYT